MTSNGVSSVALSIHRSLTPFTVRNPSSVSLMAEAHHFKEMPLEKKLVIRLSLALALANERSMRFVLRRVETSRSGSPSRLTAKVSCGPSRSEAAAPPMGRVACFLGLPLIRFGA